MRTYNKTLIGVALATLGLAGCLESGGPGGNANTQPNIETSGPSAIERGPHPVFKPLESQFPLPSDALLFLSDADDGTMLNGNFVDPDSPDYNPVTAGIGHLDGNSVLEPFDIRISESIDPETLDARDFIERDDEVIPNPDQTVFLIPLTQPSGDSRFPLEDEVAGISRMDRYERAQRLLESDDEAERTEANQILDELVAENQRIRVEVISLDGGTDNTIRILPLEPLRPNTKYAVAVTNGITTQSGTALVGAPSYQTVADPERTLSNPALQPFRDATVPARRIAARYFDLKRSATGDAGSIPDFDDVTFSTTFTTTGVDDVLLANAAPQTHFEDSVRTSERKAALEKLLDGTYNLSGVPLDDSASDRDKAINQKLFELLAQENGDADPLLFHEQDVELFDPALAQLLIEARDNRQAVTYQDIARDTDGSLDPDTALIAQAAAVRAVDLVRATA
ncbi:MAG: Ig-like domain-containing protein, partial [Pseudomonadota bacterium]